MDAQERNRIIEEGQEAERTAFDRWQRDGRQWEPEDYLDDEGYEKVRRMTEELERREQEAIEEAKQKGWPI